MTDRRFLALSWLLIGLLAWPWLLAAYDRLASEYERRHRPMWPPQDEALGEYPSVLTWRERLR